MKRCCGLAVRAQGTRLGAISMACLGWLLVGGTARVVAQSFGGSTADSGYDLKGQVLSDLQSVQDKFADLAKAIPEVKLLWRPSPDSRSLAEVFLHVAAERYVILGLTGVTVPDQFRPMLVAKTTTAFEQSTKKDRATILDELNKSWEFTSRTLSGMTNADLMKPLPKPGRQRNDGDLLYLLVADQHEHLGQAVAYARENGIVPRWSVATHTH